MVSAVHSTTIYNIHYKLSSHIYMLRFLFPDGTVIAVTEEGFCSAPLIIESSSNVQTPNHFIRKSPTPLSRRLIYKVVTDVSPNQPRWTCRKKDIHPEFYDDAKVYCSGDHVLTTGGTIYVVDVWSGNHPFYLGSRSVNLIDADQVEKFRKKFGRIGGLEQFMEIPTLKDEHFNFSFSDEDDRRCRRTSILIYRCALFFVYG
ncbi:hypothetical protein L2E82_30325 [Cichorium intybus]|uniref:Uncharacterized protein n=1 Tax=Cichorium intybus TaxID=13427 RepID=A0ACB9CZY8_CICIN|nr:hypothetical protein L2E82_30325 [Cichorium intybus]